MSKRVWRAPRIVIAVLASALLTGCATTSERTVAAGEWAVRNKLAQLEGVQMRNTFIGKETTVFGRTLFCGDINVQTGANLGFGPLVDDFKVRQKFIHFAYVFETDYLFTQYHGGFARFWAWCTGEEEN